MDRLIYEQMLRKHPQGALDAEKNWDNRAKSFHLSQQKDRSGLAETVTDFLQSHGVLADAHVLDIGGGSGRYAVPFATQARHVTVTDISGNMLELAREYALQNNLDNLSYVKTDWINTDLAELGWEKQFELAFASMCPAIRSPEGLAKMIASSRSYCLINQFIASYDSLADYFNRALELRREYDPHNDRDTVQAIFNLLWADGYEPEVMYLRQDNTAEYSATAALEQYAGRYGQIASAKGVKLEELIQQYSEQPTCSVTRNTTLAMIFWKV